MKPNIEISDKTHNSTTYIEVDFKTLVDSEIDKLTSEQQKERFDIKEIIKTSNLRCHYSGEVTQKLNTTDNKHINCKSVALSYNSKTEKEESVSSLKDLYQTTIEIIISHNMGNDTLQNFQTEFQKQLLEYIKDPDQRCLYHLTEKDVYDITSRHFVLPSLKDLSKNATANMFADRFSMKPLSEIQTVQELDCEIDESKLILKSKLAKEIPKSLHEETLLSFTQKIINKRIQDNMNQIQERQSPTNTGYER